MNKAILTLTLCAALGAAPAPVPVMSVAYHYETRIVTVKGLDGSTMATYEIQRLPAPTAPADLIYIYGGEYERNRRYSTPSWASSTGSWYLTTGSAISHPGVWTSRATTGADALYGGGSK